MLHYNRESGEYSHTSLDFWCGNSGFLSADKPNARLLAESGQDDVHCAICEGKATGAGLNGAPVICGRVVKYAPRY